MSVAEYRLGVDVPVSVWKVSAQNNATLTTTVVKKYCMPLSEETLLVTTGRDYDTVVPKYFLQIVWII